MFALRVRAEPGVDAIRGLRAWLKRGLREYGLRCLEIQQVNDRENEDMAINLNDADDQDRSVMPPGPCWVKSRVKRGNSGDDGLLRLAKNQHSLMLELEYVVIDDDEWRGKKILDFVTCDLIEYDRADPLAPVALTADKLTGLQTSVRMGRARLKAMINSAYGLMPNDNSDEAQARRTIESYSAFDGLCFMAQVEVRPAEGKFKERNYVDFIIEPGDPAYRPRGSSSTAVATSPKPRPPFDDEIPY